MTPEEFATQADAVVSPAMERLLVLAFATVPYEAVEQLVDWYLDLVREYTLRAVRSVIEEATDDHLPTTDHYNNSWLGVT